MEKEIKFISPMEDFMFKRMFSTPDSAGMLCDFLSSCIDFKDKPLNHIVLLDKEIKTTKNAKGSLLDLRVEVGNSANDTIEVDVEVQVEKRKFLNDRIAYYLSKMFANQLCEKEEYDKLHKCVSLWVVNFPFFDDEDYFRSMVMQDKKGNVLTEKIEFDCLEIPKIRKMELTGNMDKKLQWGKLFAASSEEELDMIGETVRNPEIKQAVFTIKKLTKTEEMQLELLNREKAERDRISIIAEERADAKAEGIAEGEANIIAKMRASGMSESEIESVLGIEIEQPFVDNYDDEDFEP